MLGAYHLDKKAVDAGARLLGIDARAADAEPQLDALESHINATGGILGRQLQIEYYEADFEASIDDEATRMCAHFKEHRPRPLAVMAVGGNSKISVPCLAEAGLAFLSNFSFVGPRRLFAQWPDHYFAPAGLAIDRLVEPYVAGLESSGFLDGGGNIGMLSLKGGHQAEGREALQTALERAGVKVAAEYTFPGDTGRDLLTARAHAVNAVVKFEQSGIRRVVGIDLAGTVTMAFMDAADTQRQSFRYGLNSTHAPYTMSVQGRNGSNDKASQLRDAVGVGWSPLFDVPESGHPPSSRQHECDRIYANVDVGDRSLFGQYSAYSWCDTMLALRAALERSGEASLRGLRAGIESLGRSHDMILNLRTRLGPDRHDGTAGFRLLRYVPGCRCFRYEGPTFDG